MAEDHSTEPDGMQARLARLQAMQPESKKRAAQESGDRRHLSPERHKQCDFFVADLFGASPKDDAASMEHPLFALKAGDRTVREYDHRGVHVTVKPGHDGCATIHDKDLWIYCISQLKAAANEGRPISRTVRFTAYDFLVSTNRRTDGDSYKRMAAALSRLSATQVETDIKTAGRREKSGFGLIDSWRVIDRDTDERMVAIEVTLPNWLFRAVEDNQVFSLSRDYFRLRKPLDRRIYELARKHCGHQGKWQVSVTTLHNKSGSRAKLYKFRAAIKSLAASGVLPSYHMVLNAQNDMVTFYVRSGEGNKAALRDAMK